MLPHALQVIVKPSCVYECVASPQQLPRFFVMLHACVAHSADVAAAAQFPAKSLDGANGPASASYFCASLFVLL
jgi:hypothetical protein